MFEVRVYQSLGSLSAGQASSGLKRQLSEKGPMVCRLTQVAHGCTQQGVEERLADHSPRQLHRVPVEERLGIGNVAWTTPVQLMVDRKFTGLVRGSRTSQCEAVGGKLRDGDAMRGELRFEISNPIFEIPDVTVEQRQRERLADGSKRSNLRGADRPSASVLTQRTPARSQFEHPAGVGSQRCFLDRHREQAVMSGGLRSAWSSAAGWQRNEENLDEV